MDKKIKFKERQEWEKACIENEMWFWELNTLIKIRFAFKVIMFEETLEFKQTFITCYERQKIVTLQLGWVSKA
jgi:hypothetical protein